MRAPKQTRLGSVHLPGDARRTHVRRSRHLPFYDPRVEGPCVLVDSVEAGPEPDAGPRPNAVNARPEPDAGLEPDAGPTPDAINVGRSSMQGRSPMRGPSPMQ
ncbi:hypothetical protein CRG98_020309 [Punica granatum]|uniref:Uncharacterized protein n=1 Tax=Punica granatum TaxID=22663 RepID=A0A2I0JSK3_PUNGR|nr:hypothetical protein CRG98_020309 [Punica granatum]